MRVRTATAVAALTALTLTAPLLAMSPAVAAPAVAPAVAPAMIPTDTTPAAFVPTGLKRVLDTRDAQRTPDLQRRPLGPGENYSVPLSAWADEAPRERPVVPTDATAVIVNVTATNPSTAGHLTVRRDAAQPGAPLTSTLNFKAGETVSNMISVAVDERAVGASPQISVYNSAGNTDVVVDVVGYYRQGAADKYEPVRPTRLADTRTTGGKVGQGGVLSVDAARKDLGAGDAKAVLLNVTAVTPGTDGHVTAYPSGSARPAEGSNLNYAAGRTVANQVVVPVGRDGKVDLANIGGPTDVVVDLIGFYSPSGHGLYSALREQGRLFDTRGRGVGLLPYSATAVPVSGIGFMPPHPWVVTLNVTATEPTAAGHLEANGVDSTSTGTSNLNWTPGRTVANGVTTETAAVQGSDGAVWFRNNAGSTHLLVDATGYFTTG
ncbi:hypothetical protein J5Y04_29900 [Kitasatospora sp. RG8]|uniref:hypothetical protein n=1 Tax=Kitasatospora sp. RG8 TaxID=2820815 RepID=UPI001ADF37B0|nr:hypothetical protein [Kitasatospora sp. RG8]MBP0453725.1 hypothetical protein [Kitasatospora sp. RG8]